MGERSGGPTLEVLAQRLEALTETVEALKNENAELRNEVVTLRGTPRNEPAETNRLVPLGDGERAVGVEGTVSRRALLTKAGAAAVAALGAGVLLTPREAQADTLQSTGDPGVRGGADRNGAAGVVGTGFELLDNFYGVLGHGKGGGYAGVQGTALTASAYGVFGENRNNGGQGVVGRGLGANGVGVRGENSTGYGVRGGSGGDGYAGVVGYGDNGVEGVSDRTGFSGVYGRHNGFTDGPGVTGDGKGNWPGVWGRNPTADGVTGETGGAGHSGVFGRHTGTTGYGVTGVGKGASGFGVVGKNFDAGGVGVLGEGTNGYGGRFIGRRAQLKLDPGATAGKPTTGAHSKGEISMDSAATLWVCTVAGTPGTWRKIATTAN